MAMVRGTKTTTVHEKEPEKIARYDERKKEKLMQDAGIAAFRAGNAPHIMQWGWSLCVEEHFYLLFPLFIMLLKRVQDHRRRLFALAGLCGLAVLYRAVAYALLPKPLSFPDFDAYFYYPTHARVDQFAFGLTLGYVWFHFPKQVVALCTKPAIQKTLLGVLAVSFGLLVLSRRAFQPRASAGTVTAPCRSGARMPRRAAPRSAGPPCRPRS